MRATEKLQALSDTLGLSLEQADHVQSLIEYVIDAVSDDPRPRCPGVTPQPRDLHHNLGLQSLVEGLATSLDWRREP